MVPITSQTVNSGVYAITHIASGRRYVGSAVNIRARWRRHRYQLRHGEHRNPHLSNAWMLYGEDAFRFEVLQLCSKERLISFEQIHIDSGSEFNICKVAGSRLGSMDSEETREKKRISMIGKNIGNAAAKGRVRPTAERTAISKSLLGRAFSEATRMKMAASQKGNKNAKGYTHTPEALTKMKSYVPTQEAKNKRRATMIARGHWT